MWGRSISSSRLRQFSRAPAQDMSVCATPAPPVGGMWLRVCATPALGSISSSGSTAGCMWHRHSCLCCGNRANVACLPLRSTQNQPQILSAEYALVERIDERANVLARGDKAVRLRECMDRANVVDREAVLAAEKCQSGGMARREVGRIAPEFRGADGERFRIRRFDDQQSAGTQHAR